MAEAALAAEALTYFRPRFLVYQKLSGLQLGTGPLKHYALASA